MEEATTDTHFVTLLPRIPIYNAVAYSTSPMPEIYFSLPSEYRATFSTTIMSSKAKFLFVLSSQCILPSRGLPTGWYLPELVHPYNKLAHFFDIAVASPAGGEAPLDPYSIESTKDDPECVAFLKENSSVWKNTLKLNSLLDKTSEFVGIFYVGGHGRK